MEQRIVPLEFLRELFRETTYVAIHEEPFPEGVLLSSRVAVTSETINKGRPWVADFYVRFEYRIFHYGQLVKAHTGIDAIVQTLGSEVWRERPLQLSYPISIGTRVVRAAIEGRGASGRSVVLKDKWTEYNTLRQKSPKPKKPRARSIFFPKQLTLSIEEK